MRQKVLSQNLSRRRTAVRRSLLAAVALLGVGFLPLLCAQEPQADDGGAVNIGSNRELFVDQYLIGSLDGTTQKLWPPRDEGPVFFFDQPWEGEHCGYVTIIHAGDKYQLYYRGGPTPGKGDGSDDRTCYAESDDGIHWTRPNLGFFSWEGNDETNILFDTDPMLSHNFAPFYDTNPNCPPDQRYKALAGSEARGLVAFVSPDGIHWKKFQ